MYIFSFVSVSLTLPFALPRLNDNAGDVGHSSQVDDERGPLGVVVVQNGAALERVLVAAIDDQRRLTALVLHEQQAARVKRRADSVNRLRQVLLASATLLAESDRLQLVRPHVALIRKVFDFEKERKNKQEYKNGCIVY